MEKQPIAKWYLVKRNIFWLFLIPLLFLFACQSKGESVDFKELRSHIQVSVENDNLVFRSLILPNSYAVITKYLFNKEIENKYILSLVKEVGDKKPVKEIVYTKNGYIEITIPVNTFNSEKDHIFYKDANGEYPIVVGTKSDWDEYLKSKRPK